MAEKNKNALKLLEESFRKIEEQIQEFEKKLENLEKIEGSLEIERIVKKIKKSLAEKKLDWIREKERAMVCDIWDAFNSGLISEEIFEKSLREIAKKIREIG
jgi:phosphopantothenoylcysteine synthetase/decarboxylase